MFSGQIYFLDDNTATLIANSLDGLKELEVVEDKPGTFQKRLANTSEEKELTAFLADYGLKMI